MHQSSRGLGGGGGWVGDVRTCQVGNEVSGKLKTVLIKLSQSDG